MESTNNADNNKSPNPSNSSIVKIIKSGFLQKRSKYLKMWKR